jgi:hypothetical protein
MANNTIDALGSKLAEAQSITALLIDVNRLNGNEPLLSLLASITHNLQITLQQCEQVRHASTQQQAPTPAVAADESQ